MNTTPAGSQDLPTSRHRLVAWLPIPLFLALFIAVAWFRPETSFEPRLLFPILNIVFITTVCLFVSFLAGRSYAGGESPAVLLLGCGTLSFAWGSAAAAAGFLAGAPVDFIVAVHTVTVLVSGSCHLASALAVLSPAYIAPLARATPDVALRVAYAIVTALVGIVVLIHLAGHGVLFFIEGQGATTVRQIMLALAAAAHALAAFLFRSINRRKPSRFIDWYSLALFLVAVGLAGLLALNTIGSLLGWAARIAQFTGCAYLLTAVLSLPGGSGAWRISLGETLRETERRHRSLVDLSPDAILVIANDRYVFANPAAANLFGAPAPDRLTGVPVLELVHPDFRERVRKRIDDVLGGKVAALEEMVWLRLDGSPVDVEVTGALVQFRGEKAIQVVARDVTERKLAEDALKLQSQAAADLLKTVDKQSLFDLLADRVYSVAGGAIVCVSEFDSRKRTLRLRSVRSTAAEREAAAAILGRQPEGLSAALPDHGHERWVMGELTPIRGGMAELVFRQLSEEVCERLARELDIGDIFGMACQHEDEILGTVAIMTHGRGPLRQKRLIESLVTSAALALKRAIAAEERDRIEQELRASEGLLRAVTDHTTEAIYVKDTGGRWVMANPAALRIFGKSASSEVLGKTDTEILADRNVSEPIMANDRKVLASGKPASFEEAVETPHGVRWFLSTKAPMRARDGSVVGIIGISRDITERKRFENALKEADRRKDEFIAMLSHELRNPLAPIRYAVPVIANAGLEGEPARAIAVISRQVDHLVRLVDDLLDVSRITRGTIELRRRHVTLQSIVERDVESASSFIKFTGHELEVNVSEEDIWLEVDPDRASQIVTNLLFNAAKYTPAGGRVTLEAASEGDEAVVRVIDTGIGIPPEHLTSIFDMFHQVKAEDRADSAVSLPGSKGGLGIGLGLARQLAEMHGGRIEAYSAGAGLGAEFVVRLPLATEPPAAEVQETPSSGNGKHRLKVLIVDDNADLVEMLALTVSTLGHEVGKALDGRTGLSAARSFLPDVVLLDLDLPGMNGFEVARELRSDTRTAAIKLVALTGLGRAEDQRRTQEAGFDRHLTKPTEPEALGRLLDELAQDRLDRPV